MFEKLNEKNKPSLLFFLPNMFEFLPKHYLLYIYYIIKWISMITVKENQDRNFKIVTYSVALGTLWEDLWPLIFHECELR